MKKVVLAILILLLLFSLFSCKKKQETDSSEVYYEIEFSTSSLTYAATPPETARVKAGECVAEPSALDETPTAGYVVIWTKETKNPVAYDFSTPVNASFVLHAVEIPRTYTISYDVPHGTSNGGNPTAFTKATDTIYLKDPDMSFGYQFDHWSDFKDPSVAVTEIPKGTEHDVALRAVVSSRVFEILYFDSVADDPNPKTYTFGEELSLENPLRDGYRFLGYTIYMDQKATPVTKITADFLVDNWNVIKRSNGMSICLKANWEK